jgi:hypothetical protein
MRQFWAGLGASYLRCSQIFALLAGLALNLPASAGAAPPPMDASAAAEVPVIAGWNEMLDSLRDLPGRILAKLPLEERQDPLVQQEVAQLALGAITSGGIAMLGSDVDHPMFLPLNGLIFGVGQPNADTVYKSANVDPAGVYRLRGKRGTLRMFIIAQHGPTPGDPVTNAPRMSGPAKGDIDINALPVDSQGRFDLIVSPQRPTGYGGSWWRLEPGTAKLMARLVSSDWAREKDPTLSIERLDKAVSRQRPNAAGLQVRLARLSAYANFIGPLLVTDPAELKAAGIVNRLVPKTLDRGLLAGQYYYHGAYDLTDDDALLIEVKVPAQCRYWSIILTNHLYVTTDWSNNQSSLNDSQARVDSDGTLRVVVSARDPGVPNWIDTAGYPQGLVQGRWFGCGEAPVPSARKLAIGEVRGAIPTSTPVVTPGQREQQIRERRSALQQRPLW